jgi:GNAT superfamily N-acetyltransferase
LPPGFLKGFFHLNSDHHRLEVVCRSATDADTDQVIELTRRIWDGEDYVPDVWCNWLEDELGALFIAEHDSRVLGLVKLTRIPGGDWWLEGMRVHPEYEGRGIASQLHECIYNHWIQQGDGIVRLATASFRQGIQHLSTKKEFDKIGEFSIYNCDLVAVGEANLYQEDLITVDGRDLEKILQILRNSSTMKYTLGMLDIGWKWNPPTRGILEELVKDGTVFQIQGKEQVLIFRDEIGNSWKDKFVITALAGPTDALGEMLACSISFSSSRGYRKLEWMCSPDIESDAGFQASGFRRDWEHKLYIYQRSHPERDIELPPI